METLDWTLGANEALAGLPQYVGFIGMWVRWRASPLKHLIGLFAPGVH